MKKIMTILGGICLIAAAAAWQTQTIAETNGKMSLSLTQSLKNTAGNLDVLVKLRATADLQGAKSISDIKERRQFVYDRLTATATASQGDFISVLNSRQMSYERFYLVNIVLVKNASVEDIQEFAGRQDVEKIYGTPAMNLRPPTFDLSAEMNLMAVESNIQAVGADRVWKELNIRGAGVVVAGQDTGVQWDHPALIKQYRGNDKGTTTHDYNWYDAIQAPITGGSKCSYASNIPCDDNAHGTHTIGTIVGNDGNANEIGMAPDSQWIACRNMDAGTGRPQTYMKCFEFFFAPHAMNKDGMTDGHPELAADVINNSWGCPSDEKCEGDVLLEILRNMKAAGIFVVVSAGNEGSSCKTIANTPAWHSAETFSVGAYDHRNNKIAGFSSRGPSSFDGEIGPDITAPGVSVRSSVPGSRYEGGFWSGTSMAGPHVAGLVALMWSANSNLIGQIDKTIQLIEDTADREIASGCMAAGEENSIPNNTFGYGRINAYNAVKAAMSAQ